MWVPTMDGRRRTTPIILKTLDVDTFDHSASWPSKVRNVSRLGSQISKFQSGFELAAGLPTSSSIEKLSGEPR